VETAYKKTALMKYWFLDHYYENIRTYLKPARLDHWFKNVSVLVGVIAAIAYTGTQPGVFVILKCALAIFLACLMSSVNYIINEIVDARFDRKHPNKKLRSVASDNVSVGILVAFDVFIVIAVLIISYAAFNEKFFLAMSLFFIIGGVSYNVPPVRTKDLPYIDVITESVNNPLRLMLGWYVVDNVSGPPLIALLCYWSLGAAFVTAKRLAELRFLGPEAAIYRPTFKYYNVPLLTIMYFCYVTATLATIVLLALEYKHQMLYFLLFVMIFFVWFTYLTFQQNSSVKEPEKLLRKKAFVVYCLLVFLIFCGTLFL
jgi:4-hydroxybenzoate polyprenyltransferase